MQAITDYKGQDHQSDDTKQRTKRQPALLRIVTSVTDGDTAGSTRGLKPLPDIMEQGPYESEEQFLNRISRLSAQARAEAKLKTDSVWTFVP